MNALLLLNLFLSLAAPPVHETASARAASLVVATSVMGVRPGCPSPYTVRAGDTLAAIAQRCSVSVANLMRWNALKVQRVFIGQRLITRSSQTAAPKTTPVPAPRNLVQPTPTPHIEPRIKP